MRGMRDWIRAHKRLIVGLACWHAGLFGVGLVLFYAVHPHGPEIIEHVASKPAVYLARQDTTSCEGCHLRLDPGLHLQWERSVHARANVGCAACHGEDHMAVFAAKGSVPAGVCGRCHAKAVEEFAQSGHATAEADALANARFMSQSSAMKRDGCLGCHAIGKRWDDGSVGSCNKCHPGHAFSAEAARQPEACEVCHIGPDHPQVEAYRTSVHGILYLSDRDERTAPTCATCHMPDGSHASVANLTYGDIASGTVLADSGEPPVAMRRMSREQMAENRQRMLTACGPCHTTRFARENLERADQIKLEADALVAEAAAIVRGLYDDGVLHPMPEDRLPSPTAGHALVLGGQQLYENTSGIEQAFFRLYKFHHANTYKSAYHQSPDYTHWKGIVPMKMELDHIRSEARMLRLQGARRERP